MDETVIEKVSLSARKDRVILSLTQPDPWDAEGVMNSLLTRIGGYISVIESGSLARELPETEGMPATLRIVFHEVMPDKAAEKMALVNGRLQERGIGMEFLHLSVGYS